MFGLRVQIIRKFNRKIEKSLYASIYGESAVTGKKFYNLGAGSFRHPFWTNVDHPSDHYQAAQGDAIAIGWDAMDGSPLPIEDDSASLVYCSHVIEHLPDCDAQHVLKEAHRILKRGGIFRVSTIDVDLDFRAYQSNDRYYFNWIEAYSRTEDMKRAKLKTPLNQASIQQIFLFHFASSASTLHVDGAANPIGDEELSRIFADLPYEEALDYCSNRCSTDVQKKYPGNHISWWNGPKLLDALSTAGFEKPYVTGSLQSQASVLRNPQFFDKTRPTTSLYAETVK